MPLVTESEKNIQAVRDNLAFYANKRLKQEFVPFLYDQESSKVPLKSVPAVNKINKTAINSIELFGFNATQCLRVYGKAGKLYYDTFLEMLEGRDPLEQPRSIPAGAYSYVIVPVTDNGVTKLEFRLKKATEHAHHWMLSLAEYPIIKGAGELIVGEDGQIKIAFPKTGYFWKKIKDEAINQKELFLKFFTEEYFQPENFYGYNGNEERLNEILQQKNLVELRKRELPTFNTPTSTPQLGRGLFKQVSVDQAIKKEVSPGRARMSSVGQLPLP